MSSISSVASSSQIQLDFMKLLVAELQNQNPLEPLDNKEMASQMAQFAQLSQQEQTNQNLDKVNSNFAMALNYSKRNYANSLIDKNVTFLIADESGSYEENSGVVKRVFNDPQEGCLLVVEDEAGEEYSLSLDGVMSVNGQAVSDDEEQNQ